MAKYSKELIDDLEQLLYSTQSIKAPERQRLISELNKRKLDGCSIGDEHVRGVLKESIGKISRDQEDAYIEHAVVCPVCFIINHLILIESEEGWTLDDFRRKTLLHLQELKEE